VQEQKESETLDYQLQSFPETEDYIKYTAEGEGGLKE